MVLQGRRMIGEEYDTQELITYEMSGGVFFWNFRIMADVTNRRFTSWRSAVSRGHFNVLS